MQLHIQRFSIFSEVYFWVGHVGETQVIFGQRRLTAAKSGHQDKISQKQVSPSLVITTSCRESLPWKRAALQNVLPK